MAENLFGRTNLIVCRHCKAPVKLTDDWEEAERDGREKDPKFRWVYECTSILNGVNTNCGIATRMQSTENYAFICWQRNEYAEALLAEIKSLKEEINKLNKRLTALELSVD